ncbi:Fic family protein [Halomonas sediminis]
MADWIGYRWLAAQYGIEPVQAFRTDSAIAGSRSTVHEHGYVHEFYAPLMRPADSLQGHLTFALKHERVHLEFLARLFTVIPKQEMNNWVSSEPSGRYARRAGFLYEYLSDEALDFPGVSAGNYVPALDDTQYLTSPAPINNPRWRVRNNMPGTREYCPIVLRTERVRQAEQYDCAEHLARIEAEFGDDLLMRSAVWLTVKESRASFAIEHEQQHADRVQRFAAVLEKACGRSEQPLSNEELEALQKQILGPRATRYGIRRSPVFVGEVEGFNEVVHYIAPHWDDVPSLLDGLRAFTIRTQGAPSLIRAAVLSFGFVYIHPMVDGNGRISRFLINDVLRRDRSVPEPFILPVSATVTSSVINRRGYDQILELFSRPLMQRYAGDWRFGTEQVAEDGVRYNLDFTAYSDALPAWRYPDLTDHVEYLADVVRMTVEQEMPKEASYLRDHRNARIRVKRVVEGPDSDIDRIIRSVRESGGRVSNKLCKEFPVLRDKAVAEEVAEAVRSIFDT